LGLGFLWGKAMTWADLVGYAGVALIIGSYYLLQSERWSNKSLRYALANACGSGLIIVSLLHNFNWPAFVIECFWLLISLYGLWRHRHRQQ
jgi:hypothetical protein